MLLAPVHTPTPPPMDPPSVEEGDPVPSIMRRKATPSPLAKVTIIGAGESWEGSREPTR